MAATTLLTSDQFLALPEEFDEHGNRIKDELIGGEVVRMPPASWVHDLIKNQINEILGEFLRSNRQLGLRSLVEIGTQVGDHDAFIPDVSVVQLSHRPKMERIFQGAPDLAIEVVSPTDTAKHLKRKVDAYFAGGAKSVWVVYPEAKSVEVLTGNVGRNLTQQDTINDPLLPGFSCPVSAFFELT